MNKKEKRRYIKCPNCFVKMSPTPFEKALDGKSKKCMECGFVKKLVKRF